ncbi:hypothetical protein BDR06DRAFT_1020476 [Suillus hirtellus]|nr:hypothetical protein BDR06DRAFT_1020476 [Suillus hirtellus]
MNIICILQPFIIGKVLVSGCENTNAYAWDVHAILKEVSLEDLLSIGIKLAPNDGLEQKASQDDSVVQNTPRSSLDDKSFLEADATRCADQFGDVDELSPTFFAGMEAEVDSSPMGGAHPHSSVNALFARLSSHLHRFRPQSSEANELLQTSRPSAFCPHALLARLSSLIYRFCSETDAPDELQQSSIPSRLEAKSHPTTSFSSRPDASISWLSSFFRSQPRTEDQLELSQGTMHSHAVKVPAMQDKEVLFVAEPLRPNCTHSLIAHNTKCKTCAFATPTNVGSSHTFSLLRIPSARWGNAHPTQQREGQAQAHATSSQTQHQ